MSCDTKPDERRFSRGEYWLLESVVEMRIPLSCLLDPEISLFLNKQGHGLKPEKLISTLEKLLHEGLLYIEPEDKVLTPTRAELVAMLNEKGGGKDAGYGLTTQGGEAWEEFAAPEWKHFMDQCISTDESDKRSDSQTGVWTLTCAKKRLVEVYLSLLQEVGGVTVVPESVTHKTFEPWRATYWKTLPSGHRISFRYSQSEYVPPFALRYAQMQDFLKGWYSWR